MCVDTQRNHKIDKLTKIHPSDILTKRVVRESAERHLRAMHLCGLRSREWDLDAVVVEQASGRL